MCQEHSGLKLFLGLSRSSSRFLDPALDLNFTGLCGRASHAHFPQCAFEVLAIAAAFSISAVRCRNMVDGWQSIDMGVAWVTFTVKPCLEVVWRCGAVYTGSK